MRRFYLFVLLFFVSLPVLAKNKISMVTYFPVPYVAYSQVNVEKQMDIGLTSTCNMKLGCSESLAPTLEAGQVNLNRGKLNLNGGLGITGKVLDLGSGSGEGKISFRNVRIQTGHMESVNAQDMTVDTLELFGKPFPSCKSANSESGGQMQWQKLRLKGAAKEELYLTCGGLGESTTCQPTDPRGATYTENCPSGQTGKITYTWNSSTCRYDKNDSCTQRQQITCITSSQWKSRREEPFADVPVKCQAEPHWQLGSWTTDMTCGTETVHNSGYATWDQLENCEPGKYYLYVETYTCTPGMPGYCPSLGRGWWCLKCGTVSNASQCVQKSSITNMAGKSCSSAGDGQEELKPADSELPYIP